MMDITTQIPAEPALSDRPPRDRPASAPAVRFRIRRRAGTARPLLIVEDEYVIAADLEAQIREDGGSPVRIALSVEAAEDVLEDCGADIAGVILDVNVGGTTTFGLADVLSAAGVPFIFFTGYHSVSMPDRFVGVPSISKPAGWKELERGLAAARKRILHSGLGSFRDSVEAALPALRGRARRLLRNPEEADRLVERTLRRAISDVGDRSLRLTIEDWLLGLLERTNSEGALH